MHFFFAFASFLTGKNPANQKSRNDFTEILQTIPAHFERPVRESNPQLALRSALDVREKLSILVHDSSQILIKYGGLKSLLFGHG